MSVLDCPESRMYLVIVATVTNVPLACSNLTKYQVKMCRNNIQNMTSDGNEVRGSQIDRNMYLTSNSIHKA